MVSVMKRGENTLAFTENSQSQSLCHNLNGSKKRSRGRGLLFVQGMVDGWGGRVLSSLDELMDLGAETCCPGRKGCEGSPNSGSLALGRW